MKTISAVLSFGLAVLSCGAQSLPPVGFEWDAPASLTNALGYRLDWAPGEYAAVPIDTTTYHVENFPIGLALPVSVSTIGSTTNSEPTTIHVFNVEVLLEESETVDGTNWQSIASTLLRGPRKATSFLRLRLNTNTNQGTQ